MTKLRGYIPTTFLMATLLFGSTVANAGIIIGQRAETNTCTETTTDTVVTYLKKAATFLTTGIIIGQRATTECTERNGIIIGQ